MKRLSVAILAFSILTALTFIACNKDKNSYRLDVHLTDAPAAYEEVNVDIESIKVKLREDSAGWASLDTKAGVYNLLGLQGIDSLIATAVLPSNYVQEIRFYLGTDNTIKVGGQTYPLAMDNGTQTKLMIKVDKKINGTLDSLTLDWDANLSVVQEGNGTYRLSPVIKVKE